LAALDDAGDGFDVRIECEGGKAERGEESEGEFHGGSENE
jgi:hypothetical protein